ncbi:MAG: hypothetical protein GYA24_01640 [Candidatus Lokiarchaeota archaeon]|nr:hypothetical protein [Candidatus Lokiarchaeota archaeon]
MLARILPELSAIVSWLGVKDPAHDLRIEETSTSIARMKKASILFVAIIDGTKEHYLAFDTADMRGTLAHSQVSYHGRGGSWSERDEIENPYTLATALEEILKARLQP